MVRFGVLKKSTYIIFGSSLTEKFSLLNNGVIVFWVRRLGSSSFFRSPYTEEVKNRRELITTEGRVHIRQGNLPFLLVVGRGLDVKSRSQEIGIRALSSLPQTG